MIRTSHLTQTEDIDITMPTENLTKLMPGGGNASREAFQIRNKFTEYFNSQEGSLPWQLKRVTETDII